MYELDIDSPAPNAPRPVGPPFDRKCIAAGVWNEHLYILTPGRIEVANLGGVVKSTLPFMDSEGTPLAVGIAGDAANELTIDLEDVEVEIL